MTTFLAWLELTAIMGTAYTVVFWRFTHPLPGHDE